MPNAGTTKDRAHSRHAPRGSTTRAHASVQKLSNVRARSYAHLLTLRFTYICPLSPTVYMPTYSIALPSDVSCNVDHNTLANRNKQRP